MTDRDYKILFVVAETALSKIRWAPCFSGMTPEGLIAKQALDTIEDLKKVMNG